MDSSPVRAGRVMRHTRGVRLLARMDVRVLFVRGYLVLRRRVRRCRVPVMGRVSAQVLVF
jgi:hypothetical protein